MRSLEDSRRLQRKTTALKRLASGVQLPPWPPSFLSLSSTPNPIHVPKRSNKFLRTAAGVCLNGSCDTEVSARASRCRRMVRADWCEPTVACVTLSRRFTLPGSVAKSLDQFSEPKPYALIARERPRILGPFSHSPMVESTSSCKLEGVASRHSLPPKHKKTGRYSYSYRVKKVRGWFQRHSSKAANGAGDVGRDCGNNPRFTAWPGNGLVVDLANAANVPVQ